MVSTAGSLVNVISGSPSIVEQQQGDTGYNFISYLLASIS